VPDEARLSLDLAKNILMHFFVTRGLVATALASAGKKSMTVDALRERVQTVSRLFKYEFTFRADATFERIFDETLDVMAKAGELSVDGPMVVRIESDNVKLYVEMLRNFIEGYRVAARALTLLVRGPLTAKELTKRAIVTLAAGSKPIDLFGAPA